MSSIPPVRGTGRRITLGTAAVVTAVPAALGVLLLPGAAVLGLAVLSLLVGGLVTAAPRLAGPPDATADLNPRRGALAGAGTFAGVMVLSGTSTILGAAAGPVLLVVGALLGWWAWSARRRPGTLGTPAIPAIPATERAGNASPTDPAGPADLARSDLSDLPDLPDLARSGSDLSDLSDGALCLAWRRSFTAIGRAADLRDRGLLVDLRGRYLDEIERRHPRDFARWLADGARAASDPARYMSAPPRPRG